MRAPVQGLRGRGRMGETVDDGTKVRPKARIWIRYVALHVSASTPLPIRCREAAPRSSGQQGVP